MATVQDVAAAIITRLGEVDNMKLNKLLFFAQGWSEAWRDQPLFTDEPLEGWEQGPVVDAVYQTYKDHGWHRITEPRAGDPTRLTPDERETLAAVLNRYGVLDAITLSDLTHDNEAWVEAWARRPKPRWGREHIKRDILVRSLRYGPAFGDPRQRPTIHTDPALIDKAWDGEDGALETVFEKALGVDVTSE